ncbi:MAG: PilZ domain-containing protein [Treponema sp.]|nr:PilZ domain-containing protein [Treponema sp.]
MSFFSNLVLLPLQGVGGLNRNLFERQTGSMSTWNLLYFFIGIVVIVVLLVIVNNAKKKSRNPALGGRAKEKGSQPRHFSVLALHKITSNLGLDREQSKMLEFVLRSDSVTDPIRSLNSASLLDKHFKRAYRLIERTAISEDELNNRLSVLFSTRNIIDSNTNSTSTTSTRQIPDNSAAVLVVGETNYPVKVISSRGDSLVVTNPLGPTGSPLQLGRGSKASLSFFSKSSKGFSVDTRVLGSAESADGPVMQLVHSGQIKKLSHRSARRRQTVIATAFYFVFPDDASAKKKDQKLSVDRRRFTGNIMDISIGGCSIKTTVSVNSGQMLKIEFTRDDNTVVAALGEVLRTNRTGINTIMHIKFLKVPRKSLNSINAMVYEYTDN